MYRNEDFKFCTECGRELKREVGVTRAIFLRCPLWGRWSWNHDSFFTGEYSPGKFDPVTGRKNVDQ